MDLILALKKKANPKPEVLRIFREMIWNPRSTAVAIAPDDCRPAGASFRFVIEVSRCLSEYVDVEVEVEGEAALCHP